MKPTAADVSEAMELMRTLFSFNFRQAISFYPHSPNKHTYYENRCEEWVSRHEDLLKELKIGVYWGATKVCIITQNTDWVIKVGFLGQTNPYKSSNLYDYCAIEAENYFKSIEYGCSKFFAPIYSCGWIKDVQIFLQERVNLNSDYFEDKKFMYISSQYPIDEYPESVEREEMIASDMEECDDEDIVRAIFGDTPSTDYLIHFLEENEIGDLHNENWGFTQSGEPVMIDYSGYFG